MSFFVKTFSKVPKTLLKVDLFRSYQLQLQSLRTSSVLFKDPVVKRSTEAKPQKKHKDFLKITLLQNENITVTGLEDAKNLAKRRSLHLVKIQDMDSKTQRPIYKLLTAAEMLEAELSETKKEKSDKSLAAAAKKTEKSLSIGSRIAEHDLNSRLKNITKWLSKQHEVKILIQATSEQELSNAEKIFKSIEEAIKSPQVIGRIVQKRSKGNLIKFNVLPLTTTAGEDKTDNRNQ